MNRSQKRKLSVDLKKIAQAELEIDTLFNQLIHSDNSEMTYNNAFNICNELWQKICKVLDKELKYTKPNEKYFYENYKPIEKEA
jgi:poly-D-alanine transfer protein DltD